MTEILRAHAWGTNARMIAEAVVPLGYITGSVLDATYGQHGGFWKDWQPTRFTRNDLNAPDVDCAHDFRAFPWRDRHITTVVYDPPYKLNGTPAMGDFDQRFGTGERLTLAEKLAMIRDGAIECWRLADRWLLVKCQDQVVGGHLQWMTRMIVDELVARGAVLHDQFVFLYKPIPQPARRCRACRGVGALPMLSDEVTCTACDGEGKVACRQEHTRANFSTLLVFRKPSR